MIWAPGTGRCGTRSLARVFGGVREPQPWFEAEPVEYALGRRDHEPFLRQRLTDRLALDVPAVVDLKHSYLIPLIVGVDPDARFIWLVRHPMLCIGSFLAGGAWTERDWHGRLGTTYGAGSKSRWT